MEAADAADAIREAGEGHAADERLRRRAAVIIGVLAMLLAITSLGGQNATKETINSNIQASDTYAFYQAKNIRQTNYQLAADELEALLLASQTLPSEVRATIQGRIDRYKVTIARYKSDPATGEGMQELLVKAREFEQRRDRAQRQDPNFDYAAALFQIAIVLGSVSIVATSRSLLGVSAILGAVGVVLMLNGYFLFANLPIG